MTLFAHIARTFGPHTENIAVEALGHILSSSEECRHALGGMLRTGGADIGRISDVRTQAIGGKGERPDLACRDEHDEKRALIEAKFWAGLTESQPVAYLKSLPQDKPTALLFVAPAQRFETLWSELHRQVKDKMKGIEPVPVVEEAGLRSAAAGGDRRLMLTSWAALLNRMASHASAAGDSLAEANIQQLLGLTRREDADAFLPLRPEELGPEFPRRIRQLADLVDDATVRACEAGWVSTEGLQKTPWRDGYGRYVRIVGDLGASAWFGVNFHSWASGGDTPLWLIFEKRHGLKAYKEARDRLKPLIKKNPPLSDWGDGMSVPISLPVGVEYEAVLDTVVARLKCIHQLIAQA